MRFPWTKADRDLEREIAHHLHLLTAEYLRQGHSHEEALRMARKEFGGKEQVKELCRDERPWAGLAGFWQDLAFGARMMRRTPVISLAAILSLALGIGANAAIGSLMDAGGVLRIESWRQRGTLHAPAPCGRHWPEASGFGRL